MISSGSVVDVLIACVGTSECLWQCQCRVASCTSSLRKGWAAGAQYGRWPGPSLEETWGILVTHVRKHKHSQCIVVTVKRECSGVLQRAEELTSLTAANQAPLSKHLSL